MTWTNYADILAGIKTKISEARQRAILAVNVSDLASETFNNPYILEFAGLSEKFHERELEKGLTKHVEKFIMEPGKGFTYAGSQYCISIGEKDYYPDLLFFNYSLN